MEDEKILLHDWLGDEDCSLKLIIQDDGSVNLMLYARNYSCYVLLGVFFNPGENGNYMKVCGDTLFNVEYFLNRYNLGTKVENSEYGFGRGSIYEINLDELAKYDFEGVNKYFSLLKTCA